MKSYHLKTYFGNGIKVYKLEKNSTLIQKYVSKFYKKIHDIFP